jgi:shikimate kinase
MNKKTVYLLIGQKGSGKSFTGALMDRKFGIKFIRVENWVKQIKKGREIDNPSYLNDAFCVIENGIRDALKQNDKIVFESTGLTSNFDQMLINLRKDFLVFTIQIEAEKDTCLTRVKTRDQSIHINVSDEQVNNINEQVQLKKFDTDYFIDNEKKSEDELKQEIEKIIQEIEKQSPNR